MLTLTKARQALPTLNAEERRLLDAILTAPAARTFRDYVDACRPGYIWYRHTALIADQLQAIADGRLKRLMVFVGPRMGKSEEISRLFPGYLLERFPDRWVGLCSYAAELAFTLSRNAREKYVRAGNPLAPGASAMHHWETPSGGGMWAAGVGGPITGKGFHVGIVDDPIKDAEEAASDTIRAKQKDWWESTFWSRREPEAAVIVVQTRWHEDDLSGYLLATEPDSPEAWTIVDLPSIKEPGEDAYYPATCTVVPDWREPGEPLCPDRMSLAELEKVRARSRYYFSALHQQRPGPREGGMFKREWFEIVDRHSPKGQEVRYWDKAASDQAGDWTVGAKLFRTEAGDYIVTDILRGQWASGARDKIIRQTCVADHAVRPCPQYGEQEPGASGKDAARAFVRLLEGYGAHCAPASGDKVTRADPLASAAEIGSVKLLNAPWNKALVDELCAFPTGAHDDQVDALSGAFNVLANRHVPQIDADAGALIGPSAWVGVA